MIEAEIAELRREVSDWQLLERDGIVRLERVFHFPSFAAALAFANRIGALAEAEGHHPALLTEWGRVTVTWWTHKIRGLHRNDFIMAAKTDALAAQSGHITPGRTPSEEGAVSGPPAREPDLTNARRLVEEIRSELDPVEHEIRRHPYLAALESGHVRREDLACFAGEQHYIIRSDLRSAALLVNRFGATPSGSMRSPIL